MHNNRVMQDGDTLVRVAVKDRFLSAKFDLNYRPGILKVVGWNFSESWGLVYEGSVIERFSDLVNELFQQLS